MAGLVPAISLRQALLAQPALEHARQPIRERSGIGGPIAVEQARLLIEKMRSILLERAVGLAKRGERRDQLVL